MADSNTQLVQNIQKLAHTVGEDIKAVSNKIKTLEGKGTGGSAVPTFDFTVENNGDVYVDITYPEVTNTARNTPTNTQTDTIPYGTTKRFDVNWGTAVAGGGGAGRGYLEWSPISGFGKLHLDIKMTANSGNGGVIATLPNNAPVPTALLETAVDVNNNSIYVEPNTRNIKGWGVQGNNKRYIFDIIGFWKEIK